MRTVLHTESSHGHGGQEIRTLAEVRWLLGHGWGALIACQPDSPLLAEARAAAIPVETVRRRTIARRSVAPRMRTVSTGIAAARARRVDLGRRRQRALPS